MLAWFVGISGLIAIVAGNLSRSTMTPGRGGTGGDSETVRERQTQESSLTDADRLIIVASRSRMIQQHMIRRALRS
jgi:hypothetical protein